MGIERELFCGCWVGGGEVVKACARHEKAAREAVRATRESTTRGEG